MAKLHIFGQSCKNSCVHFYVLRVYLFIYTDRRKEASKHSSLEIEKGTKHRLPTIAVVDLLSFSADVKPLSFCSSCII